MGGSDDRAKRVLRLWLRLLSSTTLIEQGLKRRLRDRFDVTLAQFDLMAVLERAGEPRTMSEISELLMVSNGNVTGVADRLGREGLVERLPEPDDRRVNRLALTEEGRRRFAEMAEAHAAWLEEMMAGLDDDALQSLQAGLSRLKEALPKERRGS